MIRFVFAAVPLCLFAYTPTRFEAASPPPSSQDAAAVPVGGVIMWWGLPEEVPDGFEICDGTVPTTKDATLRERKPDLRDRFVKGAREVSGFRPRSPVTGGSHKSGGQFTNRHVLTSDELPAHTHPIPHVHDVPAHTHALPAHAHPIGDHVHALGTWSTLDYTPGNASAEVLARNGNDASGPPLRGLSGTSNTAAAGAGPSGAGGSGTTVALPAGTNSGNNATQQAGHAHSLPESDNRPAFLEMLFIIRVR